MCAPSGGHAGPATCEIAIDANRFRYRATMNFSDSITFPGAEGGLSALGEPPDDRNSIHRSERRNQGRPPGHELFPLAGAAHRRPGSCLRPSTSFPSARARAGATTSTPATAEYLYPFHGRAVFTWEAAPGQVRERVISGDRTLIHIPPGLAHAVTNPGPETPLPPGLAGG